MRTTLLAFAMLGLVLGAVALAAPASATCVYEEKRIDPVKQDTGTAVDKVVVTYGYVRCEPYPA